MKRAAETDGAASVRLRCLLPAAVLAIFRRRLQTERAAVHPTPSARSLSACSSGLTDTKQQLAPNTAHHANVASLQVGLGSKNSGVMHAGPRAG
jgi:hypothetical protein